VRYLEDVTADQLNLEWLRSEWFKGHAGTDRSLIDDPDLADATQNRLRAELLGYRSPLLNAIPTGSHYRSVLVEEADLPRLYLLTTWDWFLDTGRSFRLTDTRQHLRSGRGGNIGGSRQEIDHAAAVEQKLPYLENYSADLSGELLVLVASDTDGPVTIIDGTHRATALLQMHDQSPNIPWRAILIESPAMASNRWHIGWDHTPEVVAELSRLAEAGEIW
jgi:hypothetical protein